MKLKFLIRRIYWRQSTKAKNPLLYIFNYPEELDDPHEHNLRDSMILVETEGLHPGWIIYRLKKL